MEFINKNIFCKEIPIFVERRELKSDGFYHKSSVHINKHLIEL